MKLLKMLHPRNLFLKDFELNNVALIKTFEDEYKTYTKLKSWFKGKQINKKKVTIYSPGCGRDMATTLMICDVLLSKENKEIEFIFLDMRDLYDGLLYELEKYTKGVKIIHKKTKDNYQSIAYFKDKTLKIIYYVQNASSFFPPELKNNIDIYYERAFELFRSHDVVMAYKIMKNTKKLGMIITDYGFNFGSQKEDFKKLKKIPKKFGLYNNFQIWQKTK